MGELVATAQGTVRGIVGEHGVHSFLGIPYAAPPFGTNRLRPPQPAPTWSGIRDATRRGPAPPQVAPPDIGVPDLDRAPFGEECLNLNLWTPDPAATALPVMVWIQGGMFEISATAAYDGSRFARDGAVCVVINWRPGAEGLLFLGDGIANVGLLDQVAALRWVRENIASFGGDPRNVTVFGESAGAMSIGALLAMPAAEGLFRRAILQSGAAHHVLSAATAERIGGDLAAELGVPPTREAIAAVPVRELISAQEALKAEMLAEPDPDRWGLAVVASAMLWQPVIDGEVLPAHPIEAIAAGASARVDVIVGTNTDDWRLFRVVSGDIDQITEPMLTGPVADHGYRSLAAYGLPVERAFAAYRARYPDAGPGDLLAAVQTDWWMRIPAIRLADAHAGEHGSTYMYEFAWPAPGFGAVHALEIPFVFDTLDAEAPLFGPLFGGVGPRQLAEAMHGAWVSFATDGDPGWPRYEPIRRATMRFDTTSHVVEDPRPWERALWDGIR